MRTSLFFILITFVVFKGFAQQRAKTMSPTSISWKLVGGSSNCYGQLEIGSKPLQYNPDVNAVSIIHQKSETYSATPAVPLGTESGVIVAEISSDWGTTWDSTCIWAGDVHAGRYPQGAIFSAPGNTNIANAFVVGCGPAINGSNVAVGNWYASKQLAAAGSTLYNTTSSTVTGAQQFISNTTSTYAVNQARHGWSRYGFTSTSDGYVRSLALVQNDQDTVGRPAKIRGVAVVKGSFLGGVFYWTSDTLIPNTIISQGKKVLSPDVRMAWSQDGKYGYVAILGALQTATRSNRGYQPIIYRTNDFGVNWNQITGIDFNHPIMSNVTDHLGLVAVTPDTFALPHFENYDLAVDSAGLLHIGATISSGRVAHDDSLEYVKQYTLSINGPNKKYLWGHRAGLRPYIYDFVGNGSGPWRALMIDSMWTEDPGSFTVSPGYSENPWDPTGVNGRKIDMGSRLQLGRTPKGSQIIFSWSESDTNFTTGAVKYNILPNIKTRLLQAACNPTNYFVFQNEINVSKPAVGQGSVNPNIASRATLHFMAPVISSPTFAMGSPNRTVNIIVPFSVTNSNPWGQITNNTNWYGKANLEFFVTSSEWGPCGFSGSVHEINSNNYNFQLFPNPTYSKVNLKFEMKDAAKADVSIYNIIGKEVKRIQMNAESGSNEISFDVNDLNSGIYFVKLSSGNVQVTRKLVVE